MLGEFIVCMAVGFLCIVLGLIIWKKQKISLIHDYHHENVKKEDVPAYTRLTGIGLIIVGTGCCITGIVNFAFKTLLGWIASILGLFIGMIPINKAQQKYNDGWLS
jgi:hypothetical protein